MMSTVEMRERAIRRALGLGLAGEVVRVRLGWYRVSSTTQPGQVYTVRVVDGHYVCECSAGQAGRPCVHAAGVYIAKVERGGGRVVAPAAPPAPALATVIDIRRRRAA